MCVTYRISTEVPDSHVWISDARPSRRNGSPGQCGRGGQIWRSLPRNDPLAAQKHVCEALSDLVGCKDLNRDVLRALLALDQRARSLGEALLINYVSRNPQARPLERRYWRSAAELSQSFASAFDHFLRYIRKEQSARGWREYAPTMVLRLIQHRQVDFLLRPFLNDAAVPEAWTQLHSAYQFADAQGWTRQPVPADINRGESGLDVTLEREYIHGLLLGVMNGGQFSPYDAFWLSQWIPDWCQALSLQTGPNNGGACQQGKYFVVDLDSAEGLKRVSPGPLGHPLYLDPAPMLALMDAEIESLRDPANPVRIASSFGRARQIKLLRKLASDYAPRPARVNRRGERKAVASTAKAVVGLGHILRMLRHEEKKKLAAAPQAVPEIEEITITVDGGYTQTPAGPAEGADRSREGPSAHEFGVPHHVWQLKDRSSSGCRLRAPVGDANRVPPGTLVAIRDEESMRWSLVVVRRLKTRIGDRIDIGGSSTSVRIRGE